MTNKEHHGAPSSIVIIDTGCANITSVKFAVERLGYSVTVSGDANTILSANKLFLPGVGTANEAMNSLQRRNLVSLIKEVESPLLGICLGMQLLGRLSEEKAQHGTQDVPCLGICDEDVRLMETDGLPLPHMGWNTVRTQAGNPLFKGIKQDDYFYFVHSFAMPVGEHTIASAKYGRPFTAALQHGHYYGVQFHPERSSKVGSRLIQNFLEL